MREFFSILIVALAAIGLWSCDDKNISETKPQPPTIGISNATLDVEAALAEAMVTPSSNSEAWYWKIEAKGATAEYTREEGAAGKKVSAVLPTEGIYTLSAYAENKDGKSSVATHEFKFSTSEAASITVSKPTFEEATMTVSFDVTPSKECTLWGWGVEDDEPETFEGNEATTVKRVIEYDTAYTFVFFAENAVGEGETVNVEVLYKAPREVPLATITLKNVSAYTLDAEISKHDDCVRYVVGAMHSEAYDKESFVEQAQASLNPNDSYPLVIFNSATESKTFSEQNLVKNTLQTSDENTGIILVSGVSYTVAVYAEDKDGCYEVYSTEQVIPEAEINGTVNVDIELTELTETSAEAKVTASEACKMVIGHLEYSAEELDGKSNDEIKEYIIQSINAVPESYTSAITRLLSDRLTVGGKYLAFAIAIKDGKIGEVAFELFTTKSAVLAGAAKITSATIQKQTTHEQLTVILTTDDKAAKVRLYAAPSNDHASYADNLEYIMSSSEYQNYREEYEVKDGICTATVDIYHAGDNYYLYAVAVDKEGTAGDMVCVAQLAGLDTEYYTTITEPKPVFNFLGNGEVTLTVNETTKTEDNVTADITVTAASDNVRKVWLLRFAEAFTKDIEDKVSEAFAADPTKPKGSVKEVELGATYTYEYMLPYDTAWGGTIIVAVVMDTDNNFNISKYYLAGVGVSEF